MKIVKAMTGLSAVMVLSVVAGGCDGQGGAEALPSSPAVTPAPGASGAAPEAKTIKSRSGKNLQGNSPTPPPGGVDLD